MARVRNGILGGFSGKVGNVIGQCYDGIQTMRAMPESVANPRTPAQIAHRQKLALAGSFLSVFNRGFGFSLWNTSSVDNGFNNALKRNFGHIVDVPGSGYQFDIFSMDLGTYIGDALVEPELLSVTKDDYEGYLEATLEWNPKSSSVWSSPNDIIILFACHSPAENVYNALYCDVLPETRSVGSATVLIPTPVDVAIGDMVYVALAVVAESEVISVTNPNNPSGVVYKKDVSNQKPGNSIQIPAKNVTRFSVGNSLKKGATKKS